MASRRTQRVSEQIHQTLASLLLSEAKDPRLSLVTITGVDVTPDLRQARVHVLAASDRLSNPDALSALKRAIPFLRRELGQLLRLRHTPELAFFIDQSLEYGQRIDSLFAKLQTDSNDPSPPQDS
jgi:ribosome-binding factor A